MWSRRHAHIDGERPSSSRTPTSTPESIKIYRRRVKQRLNVFPVIDKLETHNLQMETPGLYSAPSRSLLRGAPDPGQAEKKSLKQGSICQNRSRGVGS